MLTRSVIRTLWQRVHPHRHASPCSVSVTPCKCQSLSIVWNRGAKRKATVTIESLPQGALPPLAAQNVSRNTERYPPVLQQHLNNVEKFKDCIVLTRVGDFYEMYFEQVDEYASLVGLKKAKRNTTEGDVSMAGFQHTQLDRYLKMFVQDLGKQVAISEQIRIPEHERVNRAGAAQYDRRVTRVITPGTLVDESFLSLYEKNFLLAIHFDDIPAKTSRKSDRTSDRSDLKIGLGWVDVSSGDFYLQTATIAALPSLIARIGPREIVLDKRLQAYDASQLHGILGDQAQCLSFHDLANTKQQGPDEWTPMLEQAVQQSEKLSVQDIAAGNMILGYVADRLLEAQIKLQPPVKRNESEHLSIDKQSLRALEIKSTIRENTQQGSLLNIIRRTVTNSGARLLSQRLVSPSMSLPAINDRLDLVQEMLDAAAFRQDLVKLLSETSDTARLLQKFSIGKGDAEDLLGLARTIGIAKQMFDLMLKHVVKREYDNASVLSQNISTAAATLTTASLNGLLRRLDLEAPLKVARSITSAIDADSLSQRQRIEIERAEQSEQLVAEVATADAAGEESPKLVRRLLKTDASTKDVQSDEQDIWVMRQEASPALQAAHKTLQGLFLEKHSLAARLRADTGDANLTLKWSATHGHYCHTKGKDKNKTIDAIKGARAFASTKTTVSFFVAEWTGVGRDVESAKQRIRTEEEKVFARLKAYVFENLPRLRRNAAVLDELDVACSCARLAIEHRLVRPILNESLSHNIIGGRHPTVNVGLRDQGRQFTANDCSVGSKELVYLITGPNMAGKSTYLRQNALITILAQTGCYVPAEYAELGLVDKIFSRVGSADSLYQDQSTFMVEMLETAEILKQATPRSFVIMDEVGRGTTPQDGVAVGFACLHHLHYINQCRSLFATHFHKLADMTLAFERLGRYCTNVAEEEDGSWTYVHQLRPGVNRESHALKVARLAGLPEQAIQLAAKVIADSRPDDTRKERDEIGITK